MSFAKKLKSAIFFQTSTMANNQIRSGVACGAAVVGILNLVCGLAEAITGLVFIALPGVSSSFAFGWGRSFYGVWSGLGVCI